MTKMKRVRRKDLLEFLFKLPYDLDVNTVVILNQRNFNQQFYFLAR